ncbi:MAG: hypothetical protein R2991_06505 [Thermoanaerobaculia bacterium]
MKIRLLTLLVLALSMPVEPAFSSPGGETLVYEWSLGGFLGKLAAAIVPGHGDGALATRPVDEGLELELLITSPHSEKGDFWRYSAVIDRESGRTLRAESSYRFRGKSKEKEADLSEMDVIDVASGIHWIRKTRPQEAADLSIWSDGKVYPVVVESRGWQQRSVDGHTHNLEWFSVRAREVEGEPEWKGSLDLYLSPGEDAEPLEIVVDRKWARVRLELVDETTATNSPSRP